MVPNVYTLPYLSRGFPLVLLVLLLGTGGAGEDTGLDEVLLDSLTKNTIFSTSMVITSTGSRWSTILKVGHVGPELALCFTYCTGVFHSG